MVQFYAQNPLLPNRYSVIIPVPAMYMYPYPRTENPRSESASNTHTWFWLFSLKIFFGQVSLLKLSILYSVE